MCIVEKVNGCLIIFLVEAGLEVVCEWRSARRMEGVRNVLKVSELNKSMKEWAYQVTLRAKYEVLRCGVV